MMDRGMSVLIDLLVSIVILFWNISTILSIISRKNVLILNYLKMENNRNHVRREVIFAQCFIMKMKKILLIKHSIKCQ